MARKTWQDHMDALVDGVAWLEANAPGRRYEIDDTRRAIAIAERKMRELGKAPSSQMTERDRWALQAA